jgi:hypothetical protein
LLEQQGRGKKVSENTDTCLAINNLLQLALKVKEVNEISGVCNNIFTMVIYAFVE